MVAPSQVCPCCGRWRVNSREERLHIVQCQQRPLHAGLNARMTNSASPRRWRKRFEATVGRRAVFASFREPLAPRPLPKMAAPRLGCGSAAFLLLAAAVAAWGVSSCAGERLRSRFLQCSGVWFDCVVQEPFLSLLAAAQLVNTGLYFLPAQRESRLNRSPHAARPPPAASERCMYSREAAKAPSKLRRHNCPKLACARKLSLVQGHLPPTYLLCILL